ncbi:unannotated protein [freshwater metagenome]|uniref:Unannotated protein n=1 Tax=freshwater metagenome TaxID=449393 RepID=A0A6J6SI64_9ZZZZ
MIKSYFPKSEPISNTFTFRFGAAFIKSGIRLSERRKTSTSFAFKFKDPIAARAVPPPPIMAIFESLETLIKF